jgi:transcription initiation factor TFIIIB Brf1 subunit/transcription initiation factor TFIIB
MDVEQLFLFAQRAKRPTFTLTEASNEHMCVHCMSSDEMVEVTNRFGDPCYYLSGTRVMNDDGLPTCVSCGRAEWAYISDEPEWNGNADGDGPDMCRVGAPVNLTLYSAAWGQGTIISTRGASFAQKRMSRINFHTSMNHRDRSLHHAYDDLDRVGKAVLNLPETVMLQAKIMYRKFSEEKLTRGAVRVGVKANCIMRACNDAGVSRTTQEIADAFGIPSRDIARTADVFKETIPEVSCTSSSVTKPSDLVGRIFNDVTCVPGPERNRVRQKVIQACHDNERNIRLMGKTPKGVVSAVMYVTLARLGFPVEKEEIRRICDVSLPTLNKLEKMVTL